MNQLLQDKSLLRALWRSKYLLIILLTLGAWEATQSFSHAKLLWPVYLWGMPVQLAALVGVLLWRRSKMSSQSLND